MEELGRVLYNLNTEIYNYILNEDFEIKNIDSYVAYVDFKNSTVEFWISNRTDDFRYFRIYNIEFKSLGYFKLENENFSSFFDNITPKEIEDLGKLRVKAGKKFFDKLDTIQFQLEKNKIENQLKELQLKYKKYEDRE